MSPVWIVCIFTFLIHLTETLAYTLRLAGVRARQIAIALSFVTSTLLVSRLSNMFQAPLLGAMVDSAILQNDSAAIEALVGQFRWVVLGGSLGIVVGMLLSPTMVRIFRSGIERFAHTRTHLPLLILSSLLPWKIWRFLKSFRLPRTAMLKDVSLDNIPKGFLVMNILVTSIYTIGVLCSLLAGAMMPDFRSTALQLSGIVNGMATIMFTMFVDPSGARITDQAANGKCAESSVKSVVVFLQLGKLLGVLVLSQLFLVPFAHYILWVTRHIAHWFG